MSEKKIDTPSKKLGTIALFALVSGSILGGGIFNLPQILSKDTFSLKTLLSWITIGTGFYFITTTFQNLAKLKPTLKSGIYTYAHTGFGPFTAFIVSWGYWLGTLCINISYALLTVATLHLLYPTHFANYDTLKGLITGSLLLWGFHILVLKNMKQASSLNVITTILKILILILFIATISTVFQFSKFKIEIYGSFTGPTSGDSVAHIKNIVPLLIWSFIGIESAVVFSGRAKSQESVRKATLLGFISCWLIYFLVSVLPFGFMSQTLIAGMNNPSTGEILKQIIGKPGSVVMNTGLLSAVLSCWLARMIVIPETPFIAAQHGTFPQIFGKKNKNRYPSKSLFISNGLTQIGILCFYFIGDMSHKLFDTIVILILPAYLTSTLYLLKISGKKSKKVLMTGLIGSSFILWFISVFGLHSVLAASLFLTLGIPVYIRTRKLFKKPSCTSHLISPLFGLWEALGAVVLVLSSLLAIYLYLT